MALISPPGTDPVDRQNDDGTLAEVNFGWRNFFNSVYRICFGVTQSGTTAKRPTERPQLWTGRQYFDTTLGFEIWWNGTAWVDSTGAPV